MTKNLLLLLPLLRLPRSFLFPPPLPLPPSLVSLHPHLVILPPPPSSPPPHSPLPPPPPQNDITIVFLVNYPQCHLSLEQPLRAGFHL